MTTPRESLLANRSVEGRASSDNQKRVAAFCPERVPFLGRYLGVPVIVVEDHGDGWVTALWPDREKPKKKQPFSYRNLDWWKIPRTQVTAQFALPPFTVALAPKPEPEPS